MLWRILLIGTWNVFSYTSEIATLLLYVGPALAIDFLSVKFNQDVELV